MPERIARSDCGDFEIRIARDGTWFYKNSPIRRDALARLFATVLKRDAEGVYWLETPAERGRIEVEDAPFVAVELMAEGEGEQQRLVFRTNLDARVVADENHSIELRPSENEEGRPYLKMGGGLEALIARPVYYELVERAVPREIDGRETLGVWSAGTFFPLGPVPEDEP